MTEQRINEELAKIDPDIYAVAFRYYESGRSRCQNQRFKTWESIPRYTRCHDDVQRVIGALNPRSLYDYHEWLYTMMGLDYLETHKATAAQKCEAVLRAIGKWEK